MQRPQRTDCNAVQENWERLHKRVWKDPLGFPQVVPSLCCTGVRTFCEIQLWGVVEVQGLALHRGQVFALELDSTK